MDEVTDAEERRKNYKTLVSNLNKSQGKTCIYESPFSRTG